MEQILALELTSFTLVSYQKRFTIFSNWHNRNKNPECPYCLDEFDEYDD